jgi:hypothetical protein
LGSTAAFDFGAALAFVATVGIAVVAPGRTRGR